MAFIFCYYERILIRELLLWKFSCVHFFYYFYLLRPILLTEFDKGNKLIFFDEGIFNQRVSIENFYEAIFIKAIFIMNDFYGDI